MSKCREKDEWFWSRKGLTLKLDCIGNVRPNNYGFVFFGVANLKNENDFLMGYFAESNSIR